MDKWIRIPCKARLPNALVPDALALVPDALALVPGALALVVCTAVVAALAPGSAAAQAAATGAAQAPAAGAGQASAQPSAHGAAQPSATVAGTAGLSAEHLLALARQAVASAGLQAQAQLSATLPGVRVETEVGRLDPQLRLAACQVAEPHLPPGTRVWGSIRIGLRCVQGPVAWNVFVPAQVRVYAPAVVAAGPMPPGHVLTESDLQVQESELTAEPGATLQDPAPLLGRALAHALRPGQALRAQHVRPRQWFAAGESVTLVARGAGFAINTSGTALGAGLEGQAVRVRVENGRVVSGTPVGQRRVEVSL